MRGHSLELMFEQFAQLDIKTFGNVKTSIASLSGIAAEEVSGEDLDAIDPHYPVIACISAVK